MIYSYFTRDIRNFFPLYWKNSTEKTHDIRNNPYIEKKKILSETLPRINQNFQQFSELTTFLFNFPISFRFCCSGQSLHLSAYPPVILRLSAELQEADRIFMFKMVFILPQSTYVPVS